MRLSGNRHTNKPLFDANAAKPPMRMHVVKHNPHRFCSTRHLGPCGAASSPPRRGQRLAQLDTANRFGGTA